MKILALNNYSLSDSYAKAQQGIHPRQHCWGVDYLEEQGDEVTMFLYKAHGRNNLLKRWNRLAFNIKLLHSSKKYDAIITFANDPIIPYLPLFKRCGLLKAKLFALIHHHQEKKRMEMLFKGYDKVFFISEQVMQQSCKQHKWLKDCCKHLIWGGETQFYAPYIKPLPNNTDFKFSAITNGVAFRDNDMVQEVCQENGIDITSVEDMKKACDKTGDYPLDYPKILEFMSKCNISLIPISVNKPQYILAGLTSLIDACMLSQPIIMSDNTNISIDIEALGMGYVYKAGDREDFKAKLKMLTSDRNKFLQMQQKCRKWAIENDYSRYCQVLYNEIHS